MIIKKEDKIEIYENKNKSKTYLILLIITLLILIINSITTSNSISHIEIVSYIIIILGIIITINKIIKPARKVLEINREYLTIIYKKEQEKIDIKKIKNITSKIDMFIVNYDERQALPIFKKSLSLSVNELNNLISEYKNK